MIHELDPYTRYASADDHLYAIAHHALLVRGDGRGGGPGGASRSGVAARDGSGGTQFQDLVTPPPPDPRLRAHRRPFAGCGTHRGRRSATLARRIGRSSAPRGPARGDVPGKQVPAAPAAARSIRPLYSTDPAPRSRPTHDDRRRRRPRRVGRRNLTPVLGRYFQRSWSHGEGHRLFDTDGRAYLDFANGIAVTALGHAHPRVTAAIHAQVDRLIGPINAIGFTAPISRARGGAGGDVPGPARLGHVPQLRLRGDRRRAQARAAGHRPAGDHRLPRRLPRPDVRGDQRHDLEPQLPHGLRAAPARRLLRAVPGGLPASSTATRRRRRRRAWPSCESLLGVGRRAVDGRGSILIEPVLGEGGYNPAPASFLRELRALCDGTASCSSPTRSSRATAGPGGCGRSSTPGSCRTSCASPRPSPTACRCRRSSRAASSRSAGDAARTARRLAGTRSRARPGLAVLETIRDEDLLANAAARGAELVTGLGKIAAEDDRIGDIRGLGLMVGVEFTRDRATGEPDGDAARLSSWPPAPTPACSCSPAAASTRSIRWIPPLDVNAAEIAEAVEIFGETLAAIPRD